MRVLWIAMMAACVGTGGDPTDANPPDTRTCADVQQDLDDELATIQTCSSAADCGQVLAGSSCGCTRNLVARRDANLDGYQDLVEEGTTLQCDLPFASPCDCPEAAGYACDDGTCSWNYVSGDSAIPQCGTDNGDAITVNAVSIDGTDLVVDVTYSGGCATHAFQLCWPSQSFLESEPVQVDLEILHLDPGDKCDGKVDEDVRLSLLPLQQAYDQAYQSTTGTIDLRLNGQGATYSF